MILFASDPASHRAHDVWSIMLWLIPDLKSGFKRRDVMDRAGHGVWGVHLWGVDPMTFGKPSATDRSQVAQRVLNKEFPAYTWGEHPTE